MRKYQERGGWFLFGVAVLYVILFYYADDTLPEIMLAIVASSLFILHKLERISNALSDLNNGE